VSLLQKTDVYQSQNKGTDHKPVYGFVLVLICAALALVVASSVFAPVPIIGSDVFLVGP